MLVNMLAVYSLSRLLIVHSLTSAATTAAIDKLIQLESGLFCVVNMPYLATQINIAIITLLAWTTYRQLDSLLFYVIR